MSHPLSLKVAYVKLTGVSVVGAGIAKLVVFHRILYGTSFLCLMAPPSPAISQYTDPCSLPDTAAGDADVTCTYSKPRSKSRAR